MPKPARWPRLTPDAPPFRLSRHATLRPWARGDTLLSVHVDDEHALLAAWRHAPRRSGRPARCPVRLAIAKRPRLLLARHTPRARVLGFTAGRDPVALTQLSARLLVVARRERAEWIDRLGRCRAHLGIGRFPDRLVPTSDDGLWIADDLLAADDRAGLPWSALVRIDAQRRPLAWLAEDEDPERLIPERRRYVKRRGLVSLSAVTMADGVLWARVTWPGDILGVRDGHARRWRCPEVWGPRALLVVSPWVAQVAARPAHTDWSERVRVSDHVDVGILVGDHWERTATFRLALPDGSSPWEAADTPRFLTHGSVLHVVIGRKWYRADLLDYLPRTAPTNASTFSGSFTAGEDSIPLLTSTA